MSSNDLTYFAGIAGTGMSSLALLLARRGERVMGHDDDATASLQLLRDAGIPCTAGATPELPADVTRFVRSAAVTPEHPLATAAAARGIPVARYAEAAAAVMADSYQVVVAGTHGKSTTTGLVAWMLTEAGFGPEFLVGATSEQLDGARARSRRGLFVVEGCEYDRSFLAYRPNLAVITSVEGDHLDFYGTVERMAAAFDDLVKRVVPGGTVMLNLDDAGAAKVRRQSNLQTIGVSAKGAKGADYRAADVTFGIEETTFTLMGRWGAIGNFATPMPGPHGIANAVMALAVAHELGADAASMRNALASWHGVDRRFELLGQRGDDPVISDYAHHPTALTHLRAGVTQRYPERQAVLVYQPHQVSRTERFFDEYVAELAQWPVVLIPDVFESRDAGATANGVGADTARGVELAERLVAAVRTAGGNARCTRGREGIASELDVARDGRASVVLIVGAGSIGVMGARLIDGSRRKAGAGTGRRTRDES
jgi:UDP-N-acetylmuramate--alanine ligase